MNTKKLFLTAMAFVAGAVAFVSCDKDKEDEKKREEIVNEKDYLSVQEQQELIANNLGGIVQSVDFTNLGQMLVTICEELGYSVDLESGIEAKAQQDPVFGQRIAAIREMFDTEEGKIDFNLLNMVLDVELKESTVTEISYVYNESTQEYEEVSEEIQVLFPEIVKINYDSDCSKVNVKTTDNHVISAMLKGHNGKEGTVTVVSPRESHKVTLPDNIEVSFTLDGNTIVSAQVDYDTDMELTLIEDESENVEASLSGSKLTANANLGIDQSEFKTNLVYAENKGFTIGYTGKLKGQEFLSGDVFLDAILDNEVDWANPGSILVWAMNPDKLSEIDCNVVLAEGEVKVVASLLNPAQEDAIMPTVMTIALGGTAQPEDMEAMVTRFNEISKCEIYFKGYAKPQAKLKLAYVQGETATKGLIEDDSVLSGIIAAIANSGLVIMVETYDADGNQITIPASEYFLNDELLTLANTLKENVMNSFGPLISILSSSDVFADDEVIVK